MSLVKLAITVHFHFLLLAGILTAQNLLRCTSTVGVPKVAMNSRFRWRMHFSIMYDMIFINVFELAAFVQSQASKSVQYMITHAFFKSVLFKGLQLKVDI